jgi:AcrR family transcriptional regulator
MSDRSGEAPEVLGIADQRREQMLRAALAVIHERGYAETRIADVAERTGISPALVIYYFKTKDQLLTEAMRYSEDRWINGCHRRLAELPTAVAKLEELVAMYCLDERDPEPQTSWLVWLDFWAQSARNPEVASLREKTEIRWRDTIRSVVLAGQESGEFRKVDADSFAIMLSAVLDGLVIQIALEDPAVDQEEAYELSVRFAADQLGFEPTPLAAVVGAAPAKAGASQSVSGGERQAHEKGR